MNSYLTILKKKGFKITPLRKAMLFVFEEKRVSFSAERLFKLIKRRIPSVGLQSVYRNLSDFTRIGITEEVFIERRKTSYALCHGVTTHHHHAVCRNCGKAIEVKACELGNVSGISKRSLKTVKRQTGFLIERHLLQLQGLCNACQ